MSGISYPPGASGAGGSAAVPVFDGRGPLYGADGQIWAQPHIAVAPLYYRFPDGVLGAPTLHYTPWIGKGTKFSAADLNDQVIEMKWQGETYIIEQVVFCNASDPAGAMSGGLFTGPNKTGDAILPSAQLYANLNGTRFGAEIFDIPKVLRAAPYLFLNLDVAGPANGTFDVIVYGRTIEPNEL